MDVLLAQRAQRLLVALATLRDIHRKADADRVRHAADVIGIDQQRAAELVGRTGEARKQQHPRILGVLGGNELLRHQVHAVAQGRDQAQPRRRIEAGQCLAAEALDCVPVTTVRVRDGKVAASDGPFVETKEFLAGIYLLEAADRDEAVRLMSRNPCAPAGRIELRPIMEM